MVQDSMEFAKRCEACQYHSNFIHQPPEPLHPTVTSWPFEAWGLDVVGPITPKSSAGHAYILAGTDYFSKWAEAVALREVKKENVVDFVRNYIIYRYGVPRYIITDNGTPFCNRLMTSLCEKFKFAQRKSSMYNAPANGLAEAFNKTLCTLLSKVVSKHKRDWHEKLVKHCGHIVLRSKFDSKWDGPYVVQEVYTNGAYKIVDADGLRIGPINGKFLKRYYP
ncbi:uncharacterized protein LOC130590766 [Beta vulgaris subsp. vulgaris]|uniref:uncharacterized protein LOC130590766 n=1 Tax=Beta vulgaris subsp. vulgaris TaxID=3555 RepID=UPI002549340C|nr:uncharacterized protein LOC130590766 [Beta vulgaris subsp. vulgaris]